MIRCKSALALIAIVVTFFCAHVTGAPGATVTPSLVVSGGLAASSDGAKPSTSEARVQEDETHQLKPRISSMHVECNVSSRYAITMVTSKVSNPASKANEVTFSMVIPETAFITSFSMEIDGKIYDAYVKEKEEAKKVYQTAVSSGLAAAHVAVQARDSNHFTVSVNVEPMSKAVFRLTYEEFLTRRLGVYNLVTNLNPGQIVDDLSVDVNIVESNPIMSLLVPELRTGNEIDAQPTDTPNPFATYQISEDKLSAKVHFAPDKSQQMELMQKFKDREAATTAPSRYHGGFFDSKPEKSDPEGVMGQFVVQYDVNRDVTGEVLVNDGYFVHFFAPGDLKPLSKHVIFVLDVSGSMIGRKINQLKEAMNSILQDLNHGDYFNIIDFSYSANVYNLDDPKKNAQYRSKHYNNFYGDEENVPLSEPEVPPPPKKATPDNIEKAKHIIDQLQAMGGTNIHDALTTALKIANFGIEAAAASSNKKPKPEPMIIFLTDGDPTVGETDPEKILSAVSTLNNKKTAIFSLAFGEDADRTFLRKVSLQNAGFMRHIYEAADAAQQLRHFYRQVASPLLANVTYTYPQEQMDEASLTKKDFHYFFLGSELVVAGKLKKEVTGTPFKVVADGYDGPLDYVPLVPLIEKRSKFWPLERVWAYLTIKQLLDDKDSQSNRVEDSATKEPSKKALELALKYSFVTPLTSLVVVKPNSTSAVDAESIPAGGRRPGLPGMPGLAGMSSMSGAAGRPGWPSASAPTWGSGFSGSSYPSYSAISLRGPSIQMNQPIYLQPAAQSNMMLPVALMGGFSDPIYSSAMMSVAPPKQDYESNQVSNIMTSSNHFVAESADDSSDNGDFGVNSDSVHLPAPLTTTPWPRPTLASVATTSADKVATVGNTTTMARLALYGLEAFAWLEPYLDSEEDSFTVPLSAAGSNKLSYKLKAKKNQYASAPPNACTNSVGGGPGTCRYLTDCKDINDGFKDLSTYLSHFCDSNGFAGICCKTELP